MIRIYRERYLKHTVTDLETLNEPSSTDFPVLGNYSCDSYFGKFSPLLSDVPLTQNSEIVFQEKFPIPIEETLFFQEPVLEISKLVAEKRRKLLGNGKPTHLDHNVGPYILMDLNRKKGQEQGASSLILKVNVISYPVS
jgi:hypothetical protein